MSSLNHTYVMLLRARVENYRLLLRNPESALPGKSLADSCDLIHKMLGPSEIAELTDAWLERYYRQRDEHDCKVPA